MQKFLAKTIPLAYGKLFNLMVLFNKRAAAIKAFDVFCTIRKGKVLPKQEQFLNEAKFETIDVAGHQVQSYRWQGNGKTVLLMHGWESNTHRWRNLIKKLKQQDFNILAFDAPAHGYSSGKRLHVPLYAEVTRHVLDTYQPDFVVAHSVGGMTIHYTHYLNPDSSVEKIVTVGSPAEFEQFMDHYQGLLKFNNKVRNAMNERLKEWFGYYFHEFTSTTFVQKNSKKGLLFHDDDDLQVPVEASKKVHQHWKGSELVITKGLGHSMHQDEVNEKIVSFLKS
ncbi:alpha/beta hydrolase [Allomuricauda sp. d1]|uniref:alpha/beta fold hydrolase n=1 Tax=Allomuricauda sp. d1 TaxID=3136725 RepID=UPI0031CDFC88